jgi:hypothetical protein
LSSGCIGTQLPDYSRSPGLTDSVVGERPSRVVGYSLHRDTIPGSYIMQRKGRVGPVIDAFSNAACMSLSRQRMPRSMYRLVVLLDKYGHQLMRQCPRETEAVAILTYDELQSRRGDLHSWASKKPCWLYLIHIMHYCAKRPDIRLEVGGGLITDIATTCGRPAAPDHAHLNWHGFRAGGQLRLSTQQLTSPYFTLVWTEDCKIPHKSSYASPHSTTWAAVGPSVAILSTTVQASSHLTSPAIADMILYIECYAVTAWSRRGRQQITVISILDTSVSSWPCLFLS